MRWALFLFALGLLLPAPAHAIRCSDWNRLSAPQKSQEILYLIQDVTESNSARRYSGNRRAVARCMERHANSIHYDFDDACAQGMRTNMQALNRIMKSYTWSCVGQ